MFCSWFLLSIFPHVQAGYGHSRCFLGGDLQNITSVASTLYLDNSSSCFRAHFANALQSRARARVCKQKKEYS